MHDTVGVSYTHLDVYKRQGIPCLTEITSSSSSIKTISRGISVSYTHLSILVIAGKIAPPTAPPKADMKYLSRGLLAMKL